MRVAVLAHSFPRFPGDTHGPFVMRLSEELAKLGHEVRVLVPFDPELRTGADWNPDSPIAAVHAFRYVKPDGWHQLGYSRTLKRDVGMRLASWIQSPLYFPFAVRALTKLVREHRIDLVHAHWVLPNGWVASRVKAATGVPYVVTLHGSDVFMAEKNPLFGKMAASALSGAGHVTSCSADLQGRLAALGSASDREKISLVANGTDLPDLSSSDPAETRAALGLPAEGRLVTAVGRMVDKKGFRHLLAAAPAILAGRSDVHLVLGGGGDLLEEHQRQAAETGFGDRIHFPGVLPHPRVLDLLAASEMFVMPSVRDPGGNIDGLPVVVLEAMAAGTPVVATDVAGMPLAIDHRQTGVLVPEQDPEALATAIGEVLDAPDGGGAMGEAARRRVESDLHWGAIARVHDGIYRQVASRETGD